MIKYLKHKWQLRQLNKWIARTENRYAKAVRKATIEKRSQRDIYQIEMEEYSEIRLYRDEIDQIKTRMLCAVAGRLDLPIPDNDSWEESNVIGGRALMPKAFAELRAAVRKKRNERWSYWELRLKVLAAILAATTGLAGALIGLFATVWKK